MTIVQAFILGIVEGITEFIPVSSTGHLILTAEILQIPSSDFLKFFEVVIQLGALIPVMFLFFRKIWREPEHLKIIGIAFIPTVVGGFLFYPIVKELMGSVWVVITSLLIGGIAIILAELWMARKNQGEVLISSTEEMTIKRGFIVGLYQLLAFIPGVSRSGATIIGGLLLGISRPVIVEFSFLLAVPTIFAASSLDLFQNIHVLSSHNLVLLGVGFITAALVSYACINLLIKYVSKHTFIVFGWYRIFIACVFLMLYFSFGFVLQ